MDLETVLGLYNYWVVIFLMMTGFYMVIARRNLMKSVIGLNIFQTSVFLLYITMGKIQGGTAPIIPPDIVKAHAAEHASSEHGPAGHGAASHGAASHGAASHGAEVHGAEGQGFLGHTETDHSPSSQPASDRTLPDHDVSTSEAIDLAAQLESEQQQEVLVEGTRLAGELDGIVYSNPLPSVLMLTAIVVGIATTALALSLIVRIREDYGTIDEDKILELDRLP